MSGRTDLSRNSLAKPLRKFAGLEKIDQCNVSAEQNDARDRQVYGAPVVGNPNATP